ncbi:hypothetical protein NPIL_521561 [Nephila pilipes]|uniref:Uncharacterized protein n=1 Tax=Nephila pilipes TaxID=299642 RepID=A0A8X6MEB1_NEPPI|nr:hypothetical protein NPIL_521561 [Nephila pilipes]
MAQYTSLRKKSNEEHFTQRGPGIHFDTDCVQGLQPQKCLSYNDENKEIASGAKPPSQDKGKGLPHGKPISLRVGRLGINSQTHLIFGLL